MTEHPGTPFLLTAPWSALPALAVLALVAAVVVREARLHAREHVPDRTTLWLDAAVPVLTALAGILLAARMVLVLG